VANTPKPVLMILEDEFAPRTKMKSLLCDIGFKVNSFAYFDDAVTALQEKDYDAFVVDLSLPGGRNGVEFLNIALNKNPYAAYAVVSAYLENSFALPLLKLQATRTTWLYRIIDKNGYEEPLKDWAAAVLRYVLDRYKATAVEYHSEDIRVKTLVDDVVPIVAKSGQPVLIIGESGTGKEDIARIIHENVNNPFRTGPFVAVNCAATSDELILSDLFGHAMGAFTGAYEHRLGWFVEASGWKHGSLIKKLYGVKAYSAWLSKCGNEVGYAKNAMVDEGNGINLMGKFYVTVSQEGAEYLYVKNAKPGTLFLDEIGDLSPAAEVALLRALDGYGIRPLGYTGPALLPNCRVIAATNRIRSYVDVREPYESTQNGGFIRKDLYWRIACWPLQLPPLRERKLADGQYEWIASLRKWAARDGLQLRKGEIEEFAQELVGKEGELWDGNWRELRYVYARAKAVAEMRPGNRVILKEDLSYASQWVLVEVQQGENDNDSKRVSADNSSENDQAFGAVGGTVNPEVELRLDCFLAIRHVLNLCNVKTATDEEIMDVIRSLNFVELGIDKNYIVLLTDKDVLLNAVKRCKREGRVIDSAVDILMSNKPGALKAWWKKNAATVVSVVTAKIKTYRPILVDLRLRKYLRNPLSRIDK